MRVMLKDMPMTKPTKNKNTHYKAHSSDFTLPGACWGNVTATGHKNVCKLDMQSSLTVPIAPVWDTCVVRGSVSIGGCASVQSCFLPTSQTAMADEGSCTGPDSPPQLPTVTLSSPAFCPRKEIASCVTLLHLISQSEELSAAGGQSLKLTYFLLPLY